MARISIYRVVPLAVAIATAFFGLAYAADGNFFPPEIVPPAARLNHPSDPCMQEFTRLRGLAERDGLSFLGVARERRGSRDELCRLVGTWAQSETDVVRYVETQGANCGVLVQSAVRFIRTRSMAESLQPKVCAGDDSWMAQLPTAKPGDHEPPDR
jgi:hypothetical protein